MTNRVADALSRLTNSSPTTAKPEDDLDALHADANAWHTDLTDQADNDIQFAFLTSTIEMSDDFKKRL